MTSIRTAQVDGITLVIVGSAGNDVLTVLEASDTAAPAPLDQVSDDLGSMFDGFWDLTVLEVGARAFVIAGGDDGGFSMYEVIPDGRWSRLFIRPMC